jgi:hypothetical protein
MDDDNNNDDNNIPDDSSSIFFQQILNDIGRLAFGVIFIEVWVLNDDKTQLIRGGIWIDPVVLHGDSRTNKFQRFIDPKASDYFPPSPFSPGVGIPGTLWSASKEISGTTTGSSIRNGTIFGGGGGGGEGRNHRRNRTLFPVETVRDGETTNKNKNEDTNNVVVGNTNDKKDEEKSGASSPTSSSPRQKHTKRRVLHHRRSNTLDERQLRTTATTTTTTTISSPSKNNTNPKHRRLTSDGPMQGDSNNNNIDIEIGRWTKSWRSRTNAQQHDNYHHQQSTKLKATLSPKNVRWREISTLASDPDQPYNPRIQYLMNECGLGWVAGVST